MPQTRSLYVSYCSNHPSAVSVLTDHRYCTVPYIYPYFTVRLWCVIIALLLSWQWRTRGVYGGERCDRPGYSHADLRPQQTLHETGQISHITERAWETYGGREKEAVSIVLFMLWLIWCRFSTGFLVSSSNKPNHIYDGPCASSVNILQNVSFYVPQKNDQTYVKQHSLTSTFPPFRRVIQTGRRFRGVWQLSRIFL